MANRELGQGRSEIEQPAVFGLAKQLNVPLRWCTAGTSALLFGLGGYAVFSTDNELGTAALLIVGAFFAVVAAMGHVPRLKWGDAEMDPSAIYLAGSVAGAEKAGEEIAEVLADSPERQEMLEDAVRQVVTELWSTSLGSEREATTHHDQSERPEVPAHPHESKRETSLPRSSGGSKELSDSALDILERFANSNQVVDHRWVARALQELGYTAVTPQGRGRRHSTAAYLRWIYPGRVRKATLYQNSAGLISDSQQQLEFALTLAGGQREGGVHPKVRFYYDTSSESTVVDAARSLREFADGTA